MPDPKVLEQCRLLLESPTGLSREECERRFPELITYINLHISLVDLMRAYVIVLRPLSPDVPGVYIAEGACPCCNGNIVIRE